MILSIAHIVNAGFTRLTLSLDYSSPCFASEANRPKQGSFTTQGSNCSIIDLCQLIQPQHLIQTGLN